MNQENKDSGIVSRAKEFDRKTDEILFSIAKIALPLGIFYALYIIIFGG